MGNRADRRADKAHRRKATKTAKSKARTPMEAHVVDYATRWVDGDPTAVPLVFDPAFDDAFARMEPQVRGIVGDDIGAMLSDLRDAASVRLVAAMTSLAHGVSTRATLFLVPLYGTDAALDAARGDPSLLRTIADALTLPGMDLLHPDSHVLFSRSFAVPSAVNAAKPGEIAALTTALLDGFADGRPTEASMAAVDRIVEALLGSPQPAVGLHVRGLYAVGLRVLVDEGWEVHPSDWLDEEEDHDDTGDVLDGDAFDQDGYLGKDVDGDRTVQDPDYGVPDATDEPVEEGAHVATTPTPDVWAGDGEDPGRAVEWSSFMDEATRGIGDGSLGVFLPERVGESAYTLVVETVIDEVRTEARVRGLPSDDVDVVHYCADDVGVTLSFTVAQEVLGPVALPYALFADDPDLVDELLDELVIELTQGTLESALCPHDRIETMPHLRATRQ